MTMQKDILVVIVILAATVVLTSIDVIADLSEGSSWLHVSIEVSVIILASISSLLLIKRVAHELKEKIRLQKVSLQETQIALERYRKEAQALLNGLAVQIDKQFSHWNLSEAEKDIGLMLIKGLSLKEIAEARNVKEKTIRQQCLSLYRKSGLAGRAELAAFFLEDLLLPQPAKRT